MGCLYCTRQVSRRSQHLPTLATWSGSSTTTSMTASAAQQTSQRPRAQAAHRRRTENLLGGAIRQAGDLVHKFVGKLQVILALTEERHERAVVGRPADEVLCMGSECHGRARGKDRRDRKAD